MLKECLLSACLLLVSQCWSAAKEPTDNLLLAEGGKAHLPVVISTKASESTKAVAAELVGYLTKISGAPFEVITTGDSSSGIVLGTLAEFPDAKLEEPLRVRNQFDGKEAFVIRTEPGRDCRHIG